MFGKRNINIDDELPGDKTSPEENPEMLPEEEEGEEVKDITVDDDAEDTPRKTANTDAEKQAELNDKYLRLHADFENFRRRTNKEKSELLMYGNKELFLKILPVYDDFERAMELLEKSDNKEAAIDGVKLIFNKFTNTLQQAGLKEIDSNGKEFDPEIHEAITKIHISPDMKGKVVDTMQKGYMLNDKIIRHSKVVVGE